MNYDIVINRVCETYGLTLTDATVVGQEKLAAEFNIPPSWLVGCSYQIGTEIILGVYDVPADQVEFVPGKVSGPEIRAAAFFHEVGHRLAPDPYLSDAQLQDPLSHSSEGLTAYAWLKEREQEAWDIGFGIAAKYGLTEWSSDVKLYVKACLESHGVAAPAKTGEHLIDGEFQSDKYPWCEQGFVPLKVSDKMAQPLLWLYAKRRRRLDIEFADDLQEALRLQGYNGPGETS